MKLCVDCKHVIPPHRLDNSVYLCRLTKSENPVTGYITRESCISMRNTMYGLCGEDAVLFEEKPKPKTFSSIIKGFFNAK